MTIPSTASRMSVLGNGPAIIFVHGVGLDRTVWSAQVEAVRGTCRTISFDLPGHGTDAGSDVPSLDLDAYVADLLALMDDAGCRQATLVGGAFGGCIARRLAARQPHRVSALVLLSQIFRRSPEASADILSRCAVAEEKGVAAIMEPAVARWFSDGYRKASPEAVQAVRDMVARTHPRAFMDAYRTFATTDAELADEAGGIECPVLLLAGENDSNSTPSQSHALAVAMRDAQTVTVPGARHLLSVEAPDHINVELLQFLSQRVLQAG